ncbi:matrix-remodeling-associated protein 7 isoform X1 [Macrotis lagotis]|uniref:matrix-remodeling-associated protein 7 isoform X1 n=1 Tax=Macrotis lagotis TaxID=92651 RepID=UPI003D699126
MEALAALLRGLPLWGTALALLLASLWLWGARAPSGRARRSAGTGEARCQPEEPRAGAGKAEEEERQDEQSNSDSKKMPVLAKLEEDEEEAFSFKYSPGKLRGNQYKKMMTKEELEEEQRVRKEQLAAIFKLMKDNMETFGEMSDGDMQEQLKLYDM